MERYFDYKVFVPILLVVLFSCANCVTGQSPGCESPDYNNQIAEYTQQIEVNPKDSDAYLNRGIAYLESKRNSLALTDLNKAILLNPSSDDAFTARGDLFDGRSNSTKAIKDFDHAIKLNPKNWYSLYMRSRINLARRSYALAIDDVTKAINLNPSRSEMFYARGSAYYQTGNQQAANRDYEQAVQIIGQEIDATNNKKCNYFSFMSRGVVLTALKKFDVAVVDYNTAIELRPQDYLPYYYRAGLYIRIGEVEMAIADYTTSIQLNPDYAVTYIERAAAYDKKNEAEKAQLDRKKYDELSKIN